MPKIQDDDLTGGTVFSSYESKFEYLKTGGFYELMCVNESERASGIVAALQFRCLVCNTVQTASNQSLSNLRRHAHRAHPETREAFDMVWMSRRKPKGPRPKGSKPFFAREVFYSLSVLFLMCFLMLQFSAAVPY